MTGANLRARLADPSLYPEGAAPDRFVETHLSVLAFVGDRVYKVKKAVDTGFCDFTTLARRRHFCAEELRLNARLAPGMYLGLAALDSGSGRFGEPLPADRAPAEAEEFAVVMRRLPDGGMLDALLVSGAIDNQLLGRLATRLATFHAGAERGAAVDALAAPDAVGRAVLDNFAATRGVCGDLERDPDALADPALHAHVEAAARAFLGERGALLAERVAAGRAVDGHGDLHAGNVCIDGEDLWIYDCVEFEPAFRAGDVAGDLAFLCADIERCGFRAFAAYLARRYAELAGDDGLDAVLPFFKGYRAMVRAKVEALVAVDAARADNERSDALERAREWFNLAATYTLPPALILTCGLPATGKSWMGDRMAEALGGPIHKSDVRRKQLAGRALGSREREGYDQGLYTPENKQATYDSLLADARDDLRAGRSVVIDGSFVQAVWRRPFEDAAAELGAPLVLVEMRADEDTIRRRIERRLRDPNEPSDADFNVYLALKAQWESPTELGPGQHLVVESGGSTAAVIGRLLAAVRAQSAG